ncbi:MAG: O-antigen ligase family protein [Verrucomicrobiae bacterium]|nr:O-antigen ligase family protein [Verrucomicrobiae bacterium]
MSGLNPRHFLILLLLMLLPWAFGTVERWAVQLALLVTAALFLLTLVADLKNRALWMRPGPLAMTGLFFLILLPYTVLQGYLNPLAPGGPTFQTALPFLPASVNLVYSRDHVLLILGWFLLGWTVSRNFNSRPAVKLLVWALALNAVALVIVALLQRATGTRMLLWFRPVSFIMDPNLPAIFVGPFVNRNHFAAYMNLIWPLLLIPWREAAKGTNAVYGNLKDRHVLVAFIMSILIFGTVYSGSRAGIGIMILLLLVSLHSFRRSLAVVPRLFVLSCILLVLGFILFGLGSAFFDRLFDTFFKRDAGSLSADWRWTQYQDSWRAFQASPYWGWGPGTFIKIFPAFQSPEIYLSVQYTHNDYLQTLVETGVFGLTVFMLMLTMILMCLRRLYVRLEHGFWRAVIRAAAISLTGILIHALVDFPLQMGGLSLTAAAMVGLAFAAREHAGDGSTAPEGSRRD